MFRLKISIFKVVTCLIVCLLMGSLFAMSRQSIPAYMKPRIMVLSLSSDGQYAISTDGYQHAVLWNLQTHTSKIVATGVNVYSGYFIKNTNDYMYQLNDSNDVIVKNIQGKVLKQFKPGFATYGQIVSSNLKIYVGADVDFNVYKMKNDRKFQILVSACRNGMTGALYHGPISHSCTGFMTSQKLLNLTFSAHQKFLVGSDGLGFLYIWNLVTQQKANIIAKNNAQTFATLSPDGRYMVSGDDNGNLLVFSLKSGKLFKAMARHSYFVYAIKYIDKSHFFVFYHGGYPYATLFSLKSDKSIKKLNLLSKKQEKAKRYESHANYPETVEYVRDQAIDTSPSAHVLVMAMAKKNGILVYHYNPKTQRLKQVWAGVVKSPKRWWHIW